MLATNVDARQFRAETIQNFPPRAKLPHIHFHYIVIQMRTVNGESPFRSRCTSVRSSEVLRVTCMRT